MGKGSNYKDQDLQHFAASIRELCRSLVCIEFQLISRKTLYGVLSHTYAKFLSLCELIDLCLRSGVDVLPGGKCKRGRLQILELQN